MPMSKKILISFFIISSLFAKTPVLSPKDVKAKINEALKIHVEYKQLNTKLIERIFRNFLEDLDPNKTYFLEPEIAKWLYPSEEDKKIWLNQFQHLDFKEFIKIYDLFVQNMERKNLIEKKTPPEITEEIDIENLKEETWPHTIKDLENRIFQLKTLYLQIAKKIKDDTFLKRLEKISKKQEEKAKNKSLINCNIAKAAVKSLGPHSNYLTKSDTKRFIMEIQQSFTGIGAMLQDKMNGFEIISFVEGPAKRSEKIKIGDKIIAVDKNPVVGIDITKAVKMIRGKKGSTVLLTILRKTDSEEIKLDIPITRDTIILEKNRVEKDSFPYADGIIGYIHLHSFYDDGKTSSSKDVKKIIEDFQKKDILKGLILDLRGNSGGLLNQAVELSGLFISKGPVVSIKDGTGNIKCLRDTKGETLYKGNLIILTDRSSASCSEIVAGTLQDYKRALIVGDDRTFGKGTSQVFSKPMLESSKINRNGECVVTFAKYYTISGKSPQLLGILPDIHVPGILSYTKTGEEFAKYPLKNDSIEPNFEDNLLDIPQMHRKKIGSFYRNNLQQVLNIYSPYMEKLKENSEKRIKKNPLYQTFLKKLRSKDYSGNFDLFPVIDLQKAETIKIMQDLIFLKEKSSFAGNSGKC